MPRSCARSSAPTARRSLAERASRRRSCWRFAGRLATEPGVGVVPIVRTREWRPHAGRVRNPATYAVRGSRGAFRRAWRRSDARAPEGSPALTGSAAAAIACSAAKCPRKATRPGLVSVTCRRERESARTRETSTYPAPASADRCLLRTESEIPRLSRISENANHRTGESIAHICRRKGAWISSSNAPSFTVATPQIHDVDRKPSRRTGRPQRSQSRLRRVPSSPGPNCCGWRADGDRSRRQQAPRQT